ncbi:MAG: methyltransferase domain-containing protein [Planctomycetia bacterium]|nr:methyltransferase domain-containing protein [Planctomycetia bacterium]
MPMRRRSQNTKDETMKNWTSLKSLIYIGKQVACPCCSGNFRKFLPFGVKARENALCPRCKSLERHRLLWLYLKNKTNFFSDTDNLRVLHFAPEYFFQKIFKSMPNLDYISADLSSSSAMVKMDITNILYEDNSFDVILCCHVLEHIIDDHRALTELFRVLRPGGWAILQSPIDLKRDKTYEDTTIVSPQERERIFGLKDHVRIYGRDYKDRLEKAGFTVKVDAYVRELGDDMIKKYCLAKDEDIYFCMKRNSRE